MLFWTRALLCVGAVTAMAIHRVPEGIGFPALPPRPAPAVAGLAGEACRAQPALCAAALARSLGALAPAMPDASRGAEAAKLRRHASVPPSRDAADMPQTAARRHPDAMPVPRSARNGSAEAE